MGNSSNELPTAAAKNSNPPYRSKLCAFAADIGRWQRQGKSYRQIAALLLETRGLKVHHETIWSFVTVRERAARTKRRVLPESFMVAPEATTTAITASAFPNITPGPAGVINHATRPQLTVGPMPIANEANSGPRDMHGRPVAANRVTNLADL